MCAPQRENREKLDGNHTCRLVGSRARGAARGGSASWAHHSGKIGKNWTEIIHVGLWKVAPAARLAALHSQSVAANSSHVQEPPGLLLQRHFDRPRHGEYAHLR